MRNEEPLSQAQGHQRRLAIYKESIKALEPILKKWNVSVPFIGYVLQSITREKKRI